MNEIENRKSERWLDDLTGQIEDLVNGSKYIKFPTHKLRKSFLGQIKSMIKDTVNSHLLGRDALNSRSQQDSITHPGVGKSQGFAIMTEGNSQKGDDVLGVGPSASSGPKPEALKEIIRNRPQRGINIYNS